MRLRADIVLLDGIIKNSTLEIDDSGRIAHIFRSHVQDVDFDFGDALVVPGFVDIHVHGAGGADFMDGTVDSVRTVARTHAKHGTTSLLATTLTASQADIDHAITAIVDVMASPGDDEAVIRGIHLEGPYICWERRGAQPETEIRPPSISELIHWQALSGGAIKQITLAPELPGAQSFIKEAVSMGILVSIGHTNATADEAGSGIRAGATGATHLFNAMTPMTHRSPGTVGALLADERVYCELICDGIHVDGIVVRVAVHAKGVDKILLITDAMSGASMPDGDYQLGPQKVVVKDGSATLDDGTLAGSLLTMNRALLNVAKFAGTSIADASRMSAHNAACRLGLDEFIGSIEQGKFADISIIRPESGEVIAVLRSGRFVYFRQ